jgi:hypothetical protein
MGISMAGSNAFSYNRFDSLDEAYRSLYESKEDKEDDVSEKEEDAIKDAVKKHDKEKHSDDDEDEKESDDDDDSDDDDKEKSDKKFPSFLKKSKSEDVKEAIDPKGAARQDAARKANAKKETSDERDKRLMMGKYSPKVVHKSVKEEVISYLMNEGYANNEVSAEVMVNYMSEEWRDSILANL